MKVFRIKNGGIFINIPVKSIGHITENQDGSGSIFMKHYTSPINVKDVKSILDALKAEKKDEKSIFEHVFGK